MNWKDKTILITGGTGSFATNFIRYLIKHNKPKQIRIFSRDEHKQTQFLGNYGGIRGDRPGDILRGFIGDIRDIDRLRMAMQGVDIVIHAAALKQVQSCEYSPFETIKTNVMGAQNIIQAALENNVEAVIGISTDKAVSPLNLYGASKMCMERLFIAANAYRGTRRTKFLCTRYGNVADSRGTVVHIWREQVERGEPVAVTNPDATRFWITMEEANKFVMEVVELTDYLCGGEVVAPMLPSITVDVLRQALVPKAEVRIIGERIGDKLHELMVTKEELKHTVKHGNKLVVKPEDPSWPYIFTGESHGLTEDYSSGTNTAYLTVADVCDTLKIAVPV